jgi:hypothetical protein
MSGPSVRDVSKAPGTTSWTKPGKRVEILFKTRGDTTRGKRFGYVVGVNTSGGMHFFDKTRSSEPGEVAFLVSRTPDGRSGAIWYSYEAIRFTKPPRDLLDQMDDDERVAVDLILQGSNGGRLKELVPNVEKQHRVKTVAAALKTLR